MHKTRNRKGRFTQSILKKVIKISIVTPFFLASYWLHEISKSEPVVYQNKPLEIQEEYDPCGLEAVECDGEVEYEVAIKVTAYTASVDETDSNPRLMANNKEVFIGAVACPLRFAFGTKIEFKGYGVYECTDRMAERYRSDNYFDIYFETKDEAFQHGVKKNVQFRVLS